MRILYVIPALQHPQIRGALRHYHLVRLIAERHEVTLLALSAADVAESVRTEIGGMVRECRIFPTERVRGGSAERGSGGGALGAGRRAMAARAARTALGSAYREREASGSYDVVLFHGKSIASLLDHPIRTPLVLDFCDAASIRLRERIRHSPPAERPWRTWRYLRMRALERRLAQRTPDPAFITARDRAAVLGPGSRAPIIPNGVELGYWSAREVEREPATLLFTGVMDYPPNTDAALHLISEVMPRLRAHAPDVRLLVVGRDPPEALREAVRGASDVTITGTVDDLRPYLERATVYVAPIRYASGLQNKILEALAMGVPVVTSSTVASGLEVRSDDPPPVRTADDPDRVAAQVLDLLGSADARRGASVAGRAYVERHFDWARSAELLEELCVRASAAAQPGAVCASL